jgi:hypothetical protein
MSNENSTPAKPLSIDKEAIRKQIENNTVVLYNLKDNNAFYAITPEEARFAMDIVKKRREKQHICSIVPLKDQVWWKKHKPKGTHMFTQCLANLQVHVIKGEGDTAIGHDFEASIPQRGGVASDSTGSVFDIAVNPRSGDVKHDLKYGFMALISEAIMNYITAYKWVLVRLRGEGFFSDDTPKEVDPDLDVGKLDIAAHLIKPYGWGWDKKIKDNGLEDQFHDERMELDEEIFKDSVKTLTDLYFDNQSRMSKWSQDFIDNLD